ncbi:hypothetical protein SDC9_202887 [bioreactor metagenome]|uniref:Uncharacterized protein n=1 Tax=bioreactor metagenome TaxID=1076179 RepID=A0A645IUX2_9ZZZZ
MQTAGLRLDAEVGDGLAQVVLGPPERLAVSLEFGDRHDQQGGPRGPRLVEAHQGTQDPVEALRPARRDDEPGRLPVAGGRGPACGLAQCGQVLLGEDVLGVEAARAPPPGKGLMDRDGRGVTRLLVERRRHISAPQA